MSNAIDRWIRRIVMLAITITVVLAAAVSNSSADRGHGPAAPRLSALGAPAGANPAAVPVAEITVATAPGLEPLGQRLRERAVAALSRIGEDLQGLPTPPTIEIRVTHDVRDMASMAPVGRGVPPWAVGVAYPDLGILIVAARRGGETLDIEGTLDHELAHLALGAAIGDAAPRWLHEGFAYQHSTDWSWERAQTLASMAWWDNIAELDELERTFPSAELPVSRAYAQSYDFVGFLANRGRWIDHYDDGDRWPFRRMLAALAAGQDLNAAARSAYGSSLDELFGEWRADLRQRFFMIPAGLFGLVLWVASAVLLVLAWRRRRRLNLALLSRWEVDERQAMERAAALAASESLSAFSPPRMELRN